MERNGECGFGDTITATDIEPLRLEIKHYMSVYEGNTVYCYVDTNTYYIISNRILNSAAKILT